MEPGRIMPHLPRPSTPRLPVLVVVLAAGFVFHVRLGGLEPALWTDTVFDSQAVAACLEGDRCLVRGVATSVPGLRHGTTWLHFRILAAWAGVDLTGFHLLMHGMGALTFLVTVMAAARIAGPAAAVAVALWLAHVVSSHDVAWNVVYNNRILPLLGTISWALSLAAVTRRRGWPLFLAAGVAALTTEVHVVFVCSLPGLATAALLMPGRWRMLAGVLGTYFGVVVALSPETWLLNVANLVHGMEGSPHAGEGMPWQPTEVERHAIAGAVIIGMAMGFARAEQRRGILVLAAFLVPVLVVYEAAVLLRATTQTDKYLGAWLGCIAASVVCGATVLFRRARDRLVRLEAPMWLRVRARGWVWPAIQCMAVASIALWPGGRQREWKAPGDLPSLRMADGQRVAVAAQARGWTLEALVSRLRSPQGSDLIQWIPIASPWPAQPSSVQAPKETLTVLRVPPAWLPDTLPVGSELLDEDGESVLLLVWSESWIDWDRFVVCTLAEGSEPACHETRFTVSSVVKVEENQVVIPRWPWPVPGVAGPAGGTTGPASVEVRLSLRFPPSGGEQRVFMPVLARACTGRIVSVPGASSEVFPDGRSAVIRPDREEEGGVLVLRWHVGDWDCPVYLWPNGVPFFVEAPSEHAQLLQALLGRGRPP